MNLNKLAKENQCMIIPICCRTSGCRDCSFFDVDHCKTGLVPFDCTNTEAIIDAIKTKAKDLGVELVKKKVCKWKSEEDHDYYDTECDSRFYFSVDYDVCDFKFCPFCGGKIEGD